MIPLILGLGPQELIIILIILLLLFGGSRLAGLGKSTGRALKEFKEETKDLGKKEDGTEPPAPYPNPAPPQITQQPVDPTQQWPQAPQVNQTNQGNQAYGTPQSNVAPEQQPSSDVRKDV